MIPEEGVSEELKEAFFKTYFYFVVIVFCMHVCLFRVCVPNNQRGQKGIRSPETNYRQL